MEWQVNGCKESLLGWPTMSRIMSGIGRPIPNYYMGTGLCPPPRTIILASEYPHKIIFCPANTLPLIGGTAAGLLITQN